MPGRILIIDTVPTNRVVLKVKMLAANFIVETCATLGEAEKRMAVTRPDLVLINLSDPVEERHAFCKRLRARPATASIGIVVMGVADTAIARFAALDAGADDVLPMPLNDTLLVARIRSLLRARVLGPDVATRHAPGRAFGFEDRVDPFQPASTIAALCETTTQAQPLIGQLRAAFSQRITTYPLTASLADMTLAPIPDLFVIAPGQSDPDFAKLYDAITTMRGRPDTSLAAQLIILPASLPDVAATCLDLGADDVVPANCEAREITLRARTLLHRHRVAVACSAA